MLTFAAVERKEPPGAMVRFDGRLTTPSACAHIVRLLWLSQLYTAIMRRLSNIPGQTCERFVI
jgi:hypothetical protein